jgi:hypothetical protein
MTCRGYDAKAVKISKTVKRAAAQIINSHERGALIRSFVEIEKSNLRPGSRKTSEK